MSIVLKTDPKDLLALYAAYTGIGSWKNELESALAMHATLDAINELEYIVRKALLERAAANLARMLGEGNGN